MLSIDDLDYYFGQDSREDLLNYIQNLLNGCSHIPSCVEEIKQYCEED